MVPLADPTYSRVREKLREDIVSGYFSGGTRLKIAELVNRYGVSQMPIREALQQLQGEGLIVIEPNKGAHVRQIDQSFLENMYDIRQLIEVYLTVRSLRNFQPRDIKELETLHSKYVKAANKSDFNQCLTLNKQFHSVIYKLADNPEGQQILEKHWQLINTLRLTFGYSTERIQKVILEHQDIITAIKDNDPIALEMAAKNHCINAKMDLILKL
ncbi:transcriptional regulator, GntR family [Pedobacter nyackensis]|uniref:Transcriptional regulator, GntR family n=1 Tax=Pedobacter nyackensis TaxID=475255 RepID=A0A1W2AAT3_9SPHI|nr:transcriptional regulator, GntR family [Pedobacter nyackensis]